MKTETFHEFCKKQVYRFAGRLGWVDPADNPEPVKDLIAALELRASKGSREMAKRIADVCVEAPADPYGLVRCPTVADIIRVGQNLRDAEIGGPKYGFPGCDKCNHSGWVRVTRGGYDFSQACACRAAQTKEGS